MKKRQNLYFKLLYLLIVPLLFGSCRRESKNINKAAEAEARQVTIIDSNGKEEVIQLPLKRVVILSNPGLLKVIKILEIEDKVVGTTHVMKDLSELYPVLSQLQVVTNEESTAPDYEAIMALNPDLVIAAFWFDQELETNLEPEIQVLRLDFGPPHTYTNELRKIGRLFDREKKAEEYIQWYESMVNSIQQKIALLKEEQKLRLFQFYGGEGGMSPGPPYGTYGQKNSWVTPLLEQCGVINVSSKLKGDWIIVDPEWIVMENPEIIIREVFPQVSGKNVVGYNAVNDQGLQAIYEDLIKAPAFATTRAVKSGRIHIIDGRIIQTEWYLALQYLVKWCYPQLFADLDPVRAHQEYLTRFQRVDFDLKSQGVFHFP